MPLINTRFAAGPRDEAVYRAAEAAGMPPSVISGYDGAGSAWRWHVEGADGRLNDVVLRIRPAPAGDFTAEVGVETSRRAATPTRTSWQPVARNSLPAPSALDETWLAAQLRTARDRAASSSTHRS